MPNRGRNRNAGARDAENKRFALQTIRLTLFVGERQDDPIPASVPSTRTAVTINLRFAIKCTHNVFCDMYGKLGSPVNMILIKCETNWEHDLLSE
jgi:hypothetical protein